MRATSLLWKVAGGLSAAAVLLSCSDVDPDSEPVAPDETAEPVELSLESDAFTLMWEFEGGWDQERGFWIGETRPVAVSPRISRGGLVTVRQADWCPLVAESDGTPGTNPPDTVEVVTEAGTYLELPPFGWMMAGDGCDAANFIPPPSNPGHTPITAYYTPDGVTCADVTVRSFYSVPFTNVYAEITEFGGSSAHAAYGYPDGTGAPDPDGPGGVQPAFGLWYYGDLDATGGSAFASTVQWTFRNTDATPFDFTGRIVAEYAEVCGNGIDDDCDGRADEGCGSYTTEPCIDDIDCASGFCDPGGSCALTCPDSIQNGAETDVDCGGTGCPTCADGQSCLVDSDCTSNICRDTDGLGTLLCRAAPNPTAAGDLVITEFMPDPGATQDGEYFEIYNPGTGDLDLEGCVLRDDDSDTFTVVGSHVIEAGSYFLVIDGDSSPTYDYILSGVDASDYLVIPMAFSNTADEIVIECDGTIIDHIAYTSDEVTDSTAFQLDARYLTAADNDDPANLCAATIVFDGGIRTGTPLVVNENCVDYTIDWCRIQAPDTRPGTAYSGSSYTVYGRTYIAGLTDAGSPDVGANNTARRVRSEVGYGPVGTAAPDDGNFTWTDLSPNPAYDTSASPSFEANNDEYWGSFVVPNDVGTTYDVAIRFTGDNGANWTLCDLNRGVGQDGAENGYAAADVPQIQINAPIGNPSVAGELVFTEIFVNGPDSPEVSDWVEIYNASATTYDLIGCDLVENGGAFPFTASVVLAPGDYAVITKEGAGTNGGITPDFVFAGMSFGNSGDFVTLDCGGNVIDTVTFSGDEENEARSVHLDPSHLNATDNDLTTNFGGNTLLTWWCEARDFAGHQYGTVNGTPVYGTPGAANEACLPISYCATTDPLSILDAPGGSDHTVEGQLYVAGHTDGSDSVEPHHMLRVEFGSGTDGSADPGNDFSWATAAEVAGWNATTEGVPNNDGYEATITAPGTSNADIDYAFRMSGDNGETWTYCDSDSTDGYQSANAGRLTTPPTYAIGSCNLQWPVPDITSGGCANYAGDSCQIYGKVFVPGLTDADGIQNAINLVGAMGYGPDGTASTTWPEENWFQVDNADTGATGHNSGGDEYSYGLTIPSANGGPYDYAWRFSGDGGTTWTYCTGTGNMPVQVHVPGWGVTEGDTSAYNGLPGGEITSQGRGWYTFGSPPGPPTADVWAEHCFGPDGTFPDVDDTGWTCSVGNYVGTSGNDWVWTITDYAPATPGNYRSVWRFTGDGGQTYLYGDLGPAGAGDGQTNNMRSITVNAPTVGSLVITEVMQNPAALADSAGEWFEVYNASGQTLNLNGLVSFTDPSSSADEVDIAIDTDLIVTAGDYFVVGSSAGALDPAGDGGLAPDYVWSFTTPQFHALGNGTDELDIIFAGVTVDSIVWDNGATFPDPDGASMQLGAVGLDNAVGSNWCEGTVQWDGTGDLGTPGSANSCGVAAGVGDLAITEVFYDEVGAGAGEQWIEFVNVSANVIDLNTVDVVWNSGGAVADTLAGFLSPGAYFVVGLSTATVTLDHTMSGGASAFAPAGTNQITLNTVPGGLAIDQVTFGGATGLTATEGAALNFPPPVAATTATDNDTTATWCDAQSTFDGGTNFGTPGALNDVCPSGGAILYLEDFTGEVGRGVQLGAVNTTGTDWTVTADNLGGVTPPGDWFKVRTISGNEMLEAQDTDTRVMWTSPVIDISGATSVRLDVLVEENGDHEGPTGGDTGLNCYVSNGLSCDAVNISYSIDGALLSTLIEDWQSNGLTFATLSGDYPDDGDWVSTTVSASGLSGSTLQIYIEAVNNAGAEQLRFDNITVSEE